MCHMLYYKKKPKKKSNPKADMFTLHKNSRVISDNSQTPPLQVLLFISLPTPIGN